MRPIRIVRIERPALLVALLLASSLFAGPAPAAVDMFMKVADIDGEAGDARHKDWIVIDSLSWALETSGGGTGGKKTKTGGVPTFLDLRWTQRQDKSFPKLFEAAASGTVQPTVDIEFVSRGGAGAPFFEIELTNAFVTRLALDATTAGLPTVAGAFDYEQIKVTYQVFGKDGAPAEKLEAM